MLLNVEGKIAFRADLEVCCYRIMSFALKSGAATYRWLVNRMYTKQLSISVEACVDNTVVKFTLSENNLKDQQDVF